MKLQKEKYETKQENAIYASQRELNKNDGLHTSNTHQKLAPSNSLPLAQNTAYSLPKSSSNNNLIRYNEQIYDQASHAIDRTSKYEFKNEEEAKNQSEVHMRYEPCNRAQEKRSSAYEVLETSYDIQQQQIGGDDRKQDETNHVSSRDTPVRYQVPHDFKVGEKVTCLKGNMTERTVLPHKVNVEYRPKDFTSSLPPEMRMTDGNSTDISTLPSEDELSNGSGNVSPRMRRATSKHRGGNLASSNGSSRNHSPRPKPGVRNSHRNSANLTSSTLQEDLMKLINPDFIADDSQPSNNSLGNSNASEPNSNPNRVNNNNMLEIQNRCRSRENLCGTSASTLSVLPSNGQDNGNSGSEVILTMARPATVISNTSTASSPAPSENKMSKEER